MFHPTRAQARSRLGLAAQSRPGGWPGPCAQTSGELTHSALRTGLHLIGAHPAVTTCTLRVNGSSREGRRRREGGQDEAHHQTGRVRDACAAALLSLPGAQAQTIKLPETLTLTAYDTGSSGFNIAVAVGKTLKDKHGSDVRVLPAGNDVARLAPLKANRAQASAMGIGTYFAQESVFEFAVKEWGPQPLRLLLSVTDCNAISLGVAKDTGVKEIKDLRGKRVGIVVGSPALNQNAFAVLAFGGLTQERREAGGVLQLRRDVEGHGQQRGRRRDRVHHFRPGQGGRDLAARHRLSADAGGRQGRLGAAQQDRSVLLSAQDHLRRRHPAGRLGRAAVLSVSDLHGLCVAAGRPDLQPHQGDDRELRRLQGRRAGRGRPRARSAEPRLGDSLPRGRGPGPEGGGRLEGRARGAQPEAPQAPGDAGRGVGGLPERAIRPTTRRPSPRPGWTCAAPRSPRSAWIRCSDRAGAGSAAPRQENADVDRRKGRRRRAGSSSTIRTRAPVEAEVTRVRRLAGGWRWLLVARDRRDHLPVHQPAVHAALLRRLHAAQHRIFLPAHPVHAAVHVPDLSGDGCGAARPRALV